MTEKQIHMMSCTEITDHEDQLWKNYKATGDINLRNELVMLHIKLVEIIARKMYHVYSGFAQLDDIIGNGTLALIRAVDSFDPERGVKFDSFASLRIKGSVIDYLRDKDWVPRTVREHEKSIEKAFAKLSRNLGRDPTYEEISAETGLSVKNIESVLCDSHAGNVLSLEELLSDTLNIEYDIEDDDSKTPHEILLKKELKKKLSEAIESLGEKERLVVTLFYYENLKIKEIADVLDITPSRVCQIHSMALIKMKSRLSGYNDYDCRNNNEKKCI